MGSPHTHAMGAQHRGVPMQKELITMGSQCNGSTALWGPNAMGAQHRGVPTPPCKWERSTVGSQCKRSSAPWGPHTPMQ